MVGPSLEPTHLFLMSPHVKCEGGGENLYGGIKNPIEVDSSIVTTVPLWCGKLIVREAVLVVGAGDI